MAEARLAKFPQAPELHWAAASRAVRRSRLLARQGRVRQVVGLLVEAEGPLSEVGELCRVEEGGGEALAEVVGFREGRTLLMPLGALQGIRPGARVEALGRRLEIGLGEEMLGRVLDALGQPMDGGGGWRVEERRPVLAEPPRPFERRPIDEPLSVGVRVIDGLLTIGRGQRVGLFAGSGVGKSTLLGMMARGTDADVNVIALVGERGREVGDFLGRDLGADGLARSVVVVATSDQPPVVRMKAAHTATAIAEFYRDRGMNVLLLMDSVTRFAMAAREAGLATGEPPASKGYPPSVFAALPLLLERAGKTASGSITGFYTVLVEGDDMNEPIADAVRGILDGHIVLSRRLASRGHYPAVDLLESVSRLMPQVTSPGHQALAQTYRRLLSVYREAEDLIQVGAYRPGSSREIDDALARIDAMNAFAVQGQESRVEMESTLRQLEELFQGVPG
ncbi:MAG: FliI/YscN family ATPase [Bacillota bacterium]|nr:FliI/YscN family ATPase [Bacillota bacterium]